MNRLLWSKKNKKTEVLPPPHALRGSSVAPPPGASEGLGGAAEAAATHRKCQDTGRLHVRRALEGSLKKRKRPEGGGDGSVCYVFFLGGFSSGTGMGLCCFGSVC